MQKIPVVNLRNHLSTFGKVLTVSALLAGFAQRSPAQNMEEMWGEDVVKLRADGAERGQLFDEGNYAMFIHWGLYALLANNVDGKTYYGIGEWIMNPRMAGIPVDEYKKLAGEFNPVNFDAKEIVQIAKDAGMKYVVITSKHHDGFAMYDSAVSDFDIVDATPWGKDPMKELSAACAEAGLGFGFYYSHNQDWTYPGGNGGPTTDGEGNPATFDDYFKEKCLPQVEEITSNYGRIELVWFDTPGNMPKEYVQQLVDVVRKNQPNALVSGRAGHGLGDYMTLGDMEVPLKKVGGLWESVDTTNDSWAYAWYDEYWKSPKEILHRLNACVSRGGTYMLNIGPRGDGSVPDRAAASLREAGKWILEYPQVIYDAGPSPYTHAMPWGDITSHDNHLFLSVADWPREGKLYLPALEGTIKSATLLNGKDGKEGAVLQFSRDKGWVVIDLPAKGPEKLASVIDLEFESAPEPVDNSVWGIDPELPTRIVAEFATAEGAKIAHQRWMEKFGEWKAAVRVHKWTPEGRAIWEVDVLEPGDYNVDLDYSGEGRLVWGVEVEGGEKIQNQQNSSHNYQTFPMGWINFPEAGRYKILVSCLEGEVESASLRSIRFSPAW